MELKENEVYYNLTIKYKTYDYKFYQFFIGNGFKFLLGQVLLYHNNSPKIKLDITLINSLYEYNINRIETNSYELIDSIYYDNIDDINLNEMIKIWNIYKDRECFKKFKYTQSFIISDGTLLNKTKYKPSNLVDYIIDNKMLKMTDMVYVPFSPSLREKINKAYNEEIFDMEEFYNLKFYY